MPEIETSLSLLLDETDTAAPLTPAELFDALMILAVDQLFDLTMHIRTTDAALNDDMPVEFVQIIQSTDCVLDHFQENGTGSAVFSVLAYLQLKYHVSDIPSATLCSLPLDPVVSRHIPAGPAPCICGGVSAAMRDCPRATRTR